jgi:hypothetical protein
MKRLTDGHLDRAFEFVGQHVGNDPRKFQKLRGLARGLPMQVRRNGLYCVLVMLDGAKGEIPGREVAEFLRNRLDLTKGQFPPRDSSYLRASVAAEKILGCLKLAVEASPEPPSLLEEAVQGEAHA